MMRLAVAVVGWKPKSLVLLSPCPTILQDVVKILLQRRAGVNSKDKDNITALMEASIMDHRDVVKHLLKVMARSCVTNSAGRETKDQNG